MSQRQPVRVTEIARFTTVIDARSPAEFALDHIPGAINLPSVLAADGTLRTDAAADVDGVYCGSGVTAAVAVAALAAAGRDVALFPGSWSQWSNEPGRAVGRA